MYKIVFTDDFLDMLEEILESYSAYTFGSMASNKTAANIPAYSCYVDEK